MGRKLGILAFALQCIDVSLYLFLIYSVHRGWVLPIGGVAPRTFVPGGKNPGAATVESNVYKGNRISECCYHTQSYVLDRVSLQCICVCMYMCVR